jgi:ribosomal protein L40E
MHKGGATMLKRVKNWMKKVKLIINGEERELDAMQQLQEWKEKFDTAYAQYDNTVFDVFENVYRGTKETVKNINSRDPRAPKKTNNVPNVVYELIESEVNTTTPECIVKSKKPGFDDFAKMIQDKIMSDFETFDMENMSDVNERNTYMHGISCVLMNWNIKLGQHEFLGDKEPINYHPKQVIPQPNIYDAKKMRYMFLVSTTTKEEVRQRTGVSVDSESSERPEVNRIAAEATNTATGSNTVTTDETVEEIVCLYLDSDDDVGKFSWVGSTVTENLPKYFYPRVAECKDCGWENPQDAKECGNCGSKKLKTKVIMEETIEKDMPLTPILFPRKQKTVQQDQMGRKFVKTEIVQEVIERTVPAGTKVKIPAPKRLPILIRKNIPLNFSFRGRSDVETIRDQQESIKKVWSKVEEKILQAGGIVGIPDQLNKQPSDDVYQVWKGKPSLLSQIVVKDMKIDTVADMAFAAANYERAKSTLGITDSYQGKYDPSAKSGRAKEVQVQQSAGRLQSKIQNKFNFYADMFEMMFLFDICFAREIRPYSKKNAKGEPEYEEFNKYELLVQDATGEWFFNTDFIFKAEIGSNLPHDKIFLYNQATNMFASGAFDKRQFLEILSTLDFPIANKILEQTMEEEQGRSEMAEVLEALKVMDPQQLVAFMQLPLEEQLQMLEESKTADKPQATMGTPEKLV